MKKGYQIVKKIFDRFPALPVKLSNLFGKSDTWHRSHGYELKKDNPLANGNLSAVDYILRMVDEYEAAAPGAGKMLADELAAEFRVRFTPIDIAPLPDRDLRRGLNKEFFEAMDELEKSDISQKSEIELAKTDAELSQIEAKIGDARAHVRAQMRVVSMDQKRNLRAV